ncbi:MAG: LysR family transcriptional regulator, partial [Acidiphilium sp.]|nr:LysR family transcriptional regulator [Acidiphilium sp.]
MELRHLRYFVAVAEEEHITRAAARLCIQQPPLSQQIGALEQELGVKLFTRASRSIRLNAAGKIFLSDARRILASVNDAVRRVQQFDQGKEGNVRIGFTSSGSMHPRTQAIIQHFRAHYPLVSMKIEEGANHDLLYMVEQERLDFAFVRTDADRYATLDCACLLREPMMLAIPQSHRFAVGPQTPLPFSSLREEPLVFYRQINGSGIGAMLTEACQAAGFEPLIVEETPRIISTIQMVAAGFGCAVVPQSLRLFGSPSVVYRDFVSGSAFTVPLNLA